MSASSSLHLGILIAMVVTLVWVAPSAGAQPGEVPDAGEVSTTLSLEALGSETTLWFYGDTSVATVSFPVPDGLQPQTLNATLNLPFAMRSAALSVTQDERLISEVELPPTDFAPVAIPLDSVVVSEDSVNLALRLTALPFEGYCLDQESPIGLIDGSVTYVGTEVVPGTVADFLPPVLGSLTIAIPETPTQAESNAAVQLAATLQSRFRAQSPRVALIPLAGDASSIDAPPQPMERRIVIKESAQEGLLLSGGDNPQLLITGPPEQLTNQTRLLTDPSLDMAVSTEVVAGDMRPARPFPGNSTTLAQLGEPVLSNTGVAPQVSIPLDQTRFGHSIQRIRVHVVGSHTPVPVGIGAQMTASVNGDVFDSWPSAGGEIDHWIEIPDRLVQRYTDLVVGMETSGNTGRCGEFRPIRLSIESSSVVESTPAQPPIPAGFGSLPQALMPRMNLGITPGSFADTERATRIVVGLQRLSVTPLSTEIAPLQEVIDSTDPAVLISADGWDHPSIALPLSDQDQRISLVGFGADEAETTLALGTEIRYGSLQTVLDGNRSLLIATSNGAAGQLDELLRWLDEDPRGWALLRGSVLVAIEGRQPQLVPDRASMNVYGPTTSTAEQETQAPGGKHNSMLWAVAGVFAALAVGGVAYWAGSRRRTAPKSPLDDGDREP